MHLKKLLISYLNFDISKQNVIVTEIFVKMFCNLKSECDIHTHTIYIYIYTQVLYKLEVKRSHNVSTNNKNP